MFTHSLKRTPLTSRDKILEGIEKRLYEFKSLPIALDKMPEGAAAIYDELISIVETEENDGTRAFADRLLRMGFGDAKAMQRHKIRRGAYTKAYLEASKRLQAAVEKAEWQPPIGINETLKAITFGYGISEEDLVDLLKVIQFYVKDEQNGDAPVEWKLP